MFEQYRSKEIHELVDMAQELSSKVNNHYFDLGEVLFYIKANEVYKYVSDGVYSDGKAGWSRFCNDKLDVGYRTAQYWVSIYQYFYERTVSKEELLGIGWSKAKELVGSADNLEQLRVFIEFAKNHTVAELKAYLDANKKNQGPEYLNEYETIRFKLPTYQLTELTNALTLAKEVFECETDNEAIANMALDWVQLKIDVSEYNFEIKDNINA
jgi:hypothetical protein